MLDQGEGAPQGAALEILGDLVGSGAALGEWLPDLTVREADDGGAADGLGVVDPVTVR